MNTLSKEVQEALQKNLPAMAAGEMKTFIEQAKQHAEQVESQKQIILKMSEELKVFEGLKAKYDGAEKLMEKAVQMGQVAEAKERELELRFAKEQISQRDYVIGQFYGALALIAKNPRAIEIMNHTQNETQQPYFAGSQMVYPNPITKYENKETEHKETKE